MCRCKEENGWLDCCLVVQCSLLKKIKMNFAFIFKIKVQINEQKWKNTELEFLKFPFCEDVVVLIYCYTVKLYEDLFFQHLLMAGNKTLILLFLIWQQIQTEFV